MPKTLLSFYYLLKPLIPRRTQLFFRRQLVNLKKNSFASTWPILRHANGKPENFLGWPGGKKFAFILTHDVDTKSGHDKCLQLMEVEKSLGFTSSFNFVPERYEVSSSLLEQLNANGFEIGVHGLKHDGKLFSSERNFAERANRINYYLSKWRAVGFRAPAMHHNLEWIHRLNIDYDSSTFDTDPFEPQSDGVGKIFPFFVNSSNGGKGYIELPYTMPQDFTVFVLIRDYNLSIWLKKLCWLIEQGGMVLLNSHPDYMSFDGKIRYDEYHSNLYIRFLEHIKDRYTDQYWHARPCDIAKFWQSPAASSSRNDRQCK